jgi:cyclase
MNRKRLVARIDVKNDSAIKGIHLEGLRKVGDPNVLARKYYGEGVDEVIFMDAVASYYDRNALGNIISTSCQDVFVPITVGGGIRNLSDIQDALNWGADKVAINTKALQKPEFLREAARVFGSQCIVLSVEAKRCSEGAWEAYFANGRDSSGRDAVDWVRQGQDLGAGEILVTSVDQEGTKRGFDERLMRAVSEVVDVPLIASGGAGTVNHISSLFDVAGVDAVAIASVLHYDISDIGDIKSELTSCGVNVRR